MSTRNKKIAPKDLAKNYNTRPVDHVGFYIPPTYEPEYGHNFPIFRRTLVPTIRRDPRIQYGLNLLKGPIQSQTIFLPEEEAENPQLHETIREQGDQFLYGVRCKDKDTTDFILKTLNRFWISGLQEALLALDWGFSCSQIIYKKNPNPDSKFKIIYDSLDHIHPFDVEPRPNRRNELRAARVKGIPGKPNGVDLPIWKIFWHVHCKEHHRYFGQSRLEWVFVPWHETWTIYGARDIRRTWFMRNAYNGGVMRYPIGETTLEGGNVIQNRELAIEMMANIRTNGFLVFPDEINSEGKQAWEYEPPTGNPTPQGLMEYPSDLRYEILEGMGIPPEVIESGSEGFGAATGRKVPLMIYYSTLNPLANLIVNDIQRFILNPSLLVNLGKIPEYEIYKVVPLKSQEQKERKTDPITKTE